MPRMWSVLLLAFLSTGASGASYAQQPGKISFPPVPIDRTQAFALGKFDGSLTLQGTVTPTLRILGDRVLVELVYVEKGLYGKLLDALTPAGGCRAVYSEGSGAEFELCSVDQLRADFDKNNGHIRVRFRAELLKTAAGVRGDESHHEATLEVRTESLPTSISMVPQSLDIEDVPAEVENGLVEKIQAAHLPLEGCLAHSGLRLEDVQYAQGSEEARAVGSIPLAQSQNTYWCLMKQGFAYGSRK